MALRPDIPTDNYFSQKIDTFPQGLQSITYDENAGQFLPIGRGTTVAGRPDVPIGDLRSGTNPATPIPSIMPSMPLSMVGDFLGRNDPRPSGFQPTIYDENAGQFLPNAPIAPGSFGPVSPGPIAPEMDLNSYSMDFLNDPSFIPSAPIAPMGDFGAAQPSPSVPQAIAELDQREQQNRQMMKEDIERSGRLPIDLPLPEIPQFPELPEFGPMPTPAPRDVPEPLVLGPGNPNWNPVPGPAGPVHPEVPGSTGTRHGDVTTGRHVPGEPVPPGMIVTEDGFLTPEKGVFGHNATVNKGIDPPSRGSVLGGFLESITQGGQFSPMGFLSGLLNGGGGFANQDNRFFGDPSQGFFGQGGFGGISNPFGGQFGTPNPFDPYGIYGPGNNSGGVNPTPT